MDFSKDEFKDVLLAIVVTTAIFSYNGSWNRFFDFVPSMFIIATVSILARQWAYKRLARRYGAKAYFKLWPFGSIMSVVIALASSLKLAALGSAVIYSQKFAKWKRKFEKYSNFTELTYKEAGIIAAGGPGACIILAILSWYAFYVSGNVFFQYGTYVNAWIAASTLIPFGQLDGSKIFTWKPWFWLVMTVVSVILLFNAMP